MSARNKKCDSEEESNDEEENLDTFVVPQKKNIMD